MPGAVDLLVTEQARKEVREATQEMLNLDLQIIKVANDINKFVGKPLTNPIPSDLPKRARESSKFVSDLNAANKEAERIAGNLARAKAKLTAAESKNAKELSRLRLETQLVNKALRDESILSSKLVGAYQKLNVRRRQAAETLRNLVASEKSSNKEIRKAQREFDRYDRRVKKADRATRNFSRNVGNYESAFGKATFALRTFVGALGIYSGIEIARQVFEQVKELNGLELALNQVTETSDAFANAQSFIGKVAEESGADIFELTRGYTKFLASAKTTTLTLEQTNNIFRQTAKAAGVLGLSTDDTVGAFRALEQIMSKGKVQAEEIRGQLGERLPGAFQILAKSMGLTTAELSKQLELGNVLSDEVLPGFARELEKTYSLDLVNRVETLAAAQTRLGNAWKTFLSNVEGGEGAISRVFKGIFETVTKAIQFLDDFNKTAEETNEIFDKGLKEKSLTKEIDEIKLKSLETGKTMREVASNDFFQYNQAVSKSKDRIQDLKQQQSELKEVIGDSSGLRIQKAQLEKINGELRDEEKNLAIKQGKLDAVNKLVRNNTKELVENIKESENFNSELDINNSFLNGSIAFYKAKIAEQKSLRDSTALTTIEIAEFDKAIAELEFRLKLLRDPESLKLSLNTERLNTSLPGLETPSQDIIASELQKIAGEFDKLDERAKASTDTQKELFTNLFSTFSNYYGLDLEAFTNLLSGKENSAVDYANTLKSISSSILEGQLIRFDNEQEANRVKLDTILNDDNVSEEQKQAAQQKFDEEEKKLRVKQAKAQRTATLIQIGVDTAASIVTALAPPPLGAGPILGPGLIPFIAGLGAAQAAFVASQPLPKFKDGVTNFKGGPAIVNDASGSNYREIIGTPDGKLFSPKKRNTLVDLPKGSNVFTAKNSMEFLKSNFVNNESLQQSQINRWIMQKVANPIISSEGIRNEIKTGIKEGFKGIKIPQSKYPDNYSQY
ncbi:MAG: tape measure protein [Bacteroidota bacterium]